MWGQRTQNNLSNPSLRLCPLQIFKPLQSIGWSDGPARGACARSHRPDLTLLQLQAWRGHNTDNTQSTEHRLILRTPQNLRKSKSADFKMLLFTATVLAKKLQLSWRAPGIDPPCVGCAEIPGKAGVKQSFGSPWEWQKSHPKALGPCAEPLQLCV